MLSSQGYTERSHRHVLFFSRRYTVDFRYSLVGLLIGFLVGLTGMGGGSLIATILILFLRVPPVWAVGTDIA